MLIRNLEKQTTEQDISSYNAADHFFIIADIDEIGEKAAETLNIFPHSREVYHKVDGNIKFESNEGYDFISFVFLQHDGESCLFEKVSIYHAANFVMLVLDQKQNTFKRIIDNLKIGQIRTGSGKKDLAGIFYRFLNGTISDMLNSLNRYEEVLTDMEARLLKNVDSESFEDIVEAKGLSFAIKKNLRFLLYISDQIVDDENRLIPPKSAKYFKNLDFRINRLYEFSEGLHEMADHLMNLYDSAVTSKTNRLLNKLTTITIFATPLTVITGVYGMNFVNMPELEKQYGYFVVLGIMASCLGITYMILKKMKII